ncbi:MAG: CBS domain-containing protein [Planctomycetes bacterium]|nr:CBS domain-containing protein [Planctomycetota bacterium]
MNTLHDLVGKQERVVFVDATATVREAAKAMAKSNVGCTAIMDGKRLIGLFTERDVLKRVLLLDKNVDEIVVGDIMTREVVVAQENQSVLDAHLLMKRHHIRHLPVLDSEGLLVGVLSIRDLLIDEMADLRRYIALVDG